MTLVSRCAGFLLVGILALSGCDQRSAIEAAGNQADAQPQTVDVPQTVTGVAPGTTPMAQRWPSSGAQQAQRISGTSR